MGGSVEDWQPFFGEDSPRSSVETARIELRLR